jgi:hypothetical protein
MLKNGALSKISQTTDKGHGRIEVRSIWTSEDLNEYPEFPYVGQVFCVRREVTHLGKNKENGLTPGND